MLWEAARLVCLSHGSLLDHSQELCSVTRAKAKSTQPDTHTHSVFHMCTHTHTHVRSPFSPRGAQCFLPTRIRDTLASCFVFCCQGFFFPPPFPHSPLLAPSPLSLYMADQGSTKGAVRLSVYVCVCVCAVSGCSQQMKSDHFCPNYPRKILGSFPHWLRTCLAVSTCAVQSQTAGDLLLKYFEIVNVLMAQLHTVLIVAKGCVLVGA